MISLKPRAESIHEKKRRRVNARVDLFFAILGPIQKYLNN
jgi:hypothetical protein